MDLNDFLKSSDTDTKHKVFISYYHNDDEEYRSEFEERFGHLFINKSVEPGDIDEESSDDYIKRLIQEDYISDSSVLIVLVGAKTYCRKHVDWEISAAISKKVGGYSGLLGLCLPTHPSYEEDKYKSDVVPVRLVDNLKSKYASLYDWTESEENIEKWVEIAFENRISQSDKIDNSRDQFTDDTCE